jgi:hypothetical protein
MALFDKLFGKLNPKPPSDQTEAILETHLDGDFTVFPMAKTLQSSADVKNIGRKLGISYPPEFCAHIGGRFPGLYVEVKKEVWSRPKEYDVGPFWSFLYALHTYTSATDSVPWMRLDCAAETFRSRTGLLAAPVLRIVGDADLYCTNAQGQLVQFRHETNELEPVRLSFWQLLEREIRELRERKDRKKAARKND